MDELTRDDAASVVEWLAADARVTLEDFDRYGLYEFLWALNGSRWRLSPAQARQVSRQAAAALVGKIAELYRVRWTDQEIVAGPLPASVLDDDASWEIGEEYVALVAT